MMIPFSFSSQPERRYQHKRYLLTLKGKSNLIRRILSVSFALWNKNLLKLTFVLKCSDNRMWNFLSQNEQHSCSNFLILFTPNYDQIQKRLEYLTLHLYFLTEFFKLKNRSSIVQKNFNIFFLSLINTQSKLTNFS